MGLRSIAGGDERFSEIGILSRRIGTLRSVAGAFPKGARFPESGILSTFPERFDVPQIRSGAGEAQGRVDVHVAFNKPGKGVEGGEQGGPAQSVRSFVVHGDEPHVPLGNGVFGKPGDFPEDGDAGVCFDALPDEGGVPRGSHTVEDHAREIDGLEVGQPGNDRGGGAGHLGDREGEQDGRAKSAGECRGGAAPLHVAPVVQAPVAFNNGKVGIAE